MVPPNAQCIHGAPRSNPDAPFFAAYSPTPAPRFFNPDGPALMTERPVYIDTSTVRICIASTRKFDLNEVDTNIDHDKPWVLENGPLELKRQPVVKFQHDLKLLLSENYGLIMTLSLQKIQRK